MKLTWYGHSAFRVEGGDAKILIDPFLTGNPSWGKGWEGPAEGVTHVLLTHGHNDHIGDAAAILKKTAPCWSPISRSACILVGQGVEAARSIPAITAERSIAAASRPPSCRRCIRRPSGRATAATPISAIPAGLVLHFPDDKTLYHMGDTDIFSDMALINELHEPKIGIVPIGDRFTMGGAVAALACRRFFNFETVIPCHYATFRMLDQTADKFVAGMEGSAIEGAWLPKVGTSDDLNV